MKLQLSRYVYGSQRDMKGYNEPASGLVFYEMFLCRI